MAVCDVCRIRTAVFDGKTVYGPWAFMCKPCHKKVGVGLGLGKGSVLKDTKESEDKE